MKLLTAPTAQAKMAKSAKDGKYLPYILHLAPSTLSGYNTCPMATKGCAAACLNTAGMGIFDNVQKARIEKTKFFYENRQAFFDQLVKEIASAERKAIREGKQLTLRLNDHLTFSAADGNDDHVELAISKGMNVSVVFRGDNLPRNWSKRKVIDGDVDDLRFRDPRGVIVGLRAKGKAKKDTTGFVKD